MQVLILAHSPDRPPEKKPLRIPHPPPPIPTHIAWSHQVFPRLSFAAKALSKIQCTASSLGPSNSEVIDCDTSPLVAAFESLLAGVHNVHLLQLQFI